MLLMIVKKKYIVFLKGQVFNKVVTKSFSPGINQYYWDMDICDHTSIWDEKNDDLEIK